MPDSLVDLEDRRSAVQSQIAQLGDMRFRFHYGNWWSLWKSKLSVSPNR